MFERAIIVSGSFVLVIFGILSVKYYRFFNNQNQALILQKSIISNDT